MSGESSDGAQLTEKQRWLLNELDDLDREALAVLPQAIQHFKQRSQTRRTVLQGGLMAGLGAGAFGLGKMSTPAKAASTSDRQVGVPSEEVDILIDEIRDPGGDVVADIDDTGDIDWQGRGFDNLSSVTTGQADIATPYTFVDSDAQFSNLTLQNDLVVFLGDVDLSGQTISSSVTLKGPNPRSDTQGFRLVGNLTLDADNSGLFGGFTNLNDVTINGQNSRVGWINCNSSITINADDVMLFGVFGNGSVTFASGTSGGYISHHSVSVTDNGTNTEL